MILKYQIFRNKLQKQHATDNKTIFQYFVQSEIDILYRYNTK